MPARQNPASHFVNCFQPLFVAVLFCCGLFGNTGLLSAQTNEAAPAPPAPSALALESERPTLQSLKRRSPQERWSRMRHKWSNDPSTAASDLQGSPELLDFDSRLLRTPADTDAVGEESEFGLESDEPVELVTPRFDPIPEVETTYFDESPPAAEPREEVEEEVMDQPRGAVIVQLPPEPQQRLIPNGQASNRSIALGKIDDILPYIDYEPDPQVAAQDPCLNLCPRPDGLDCKDVPANSAAYLCPKIVELSDQTYEGRMFEESLFAWYAPDLWHNPLYFEDAPLERYGHTHHCLVQPFVSVGKFGVQTAAIPYQMAIDPICSKRYTLGWYRPGECAPKKIYQPPLNADAAAAATGVYTGLFFLIP